ncbi:MAG: HD-GYP domain-containing protein [Ruminococcaceae bacterium]|nr:HD-GYP domain-containing protein [Oscillospiraceae bacterium]
MVYNVIRYYYKQIGGDESVMKKIRKESLITVIFGTALVVTLLLLVSYYMWIRYDNQKLHKVSLSETTFSDGVYTLDDFTVKIAPRGGDSGAWNKDPILDETGSVLHNQMVGTIYELTLTNTSGARITDWTMELFIPEHLWLNNAWCGTLEFQQTTSGELLVQELDLREFTTKEITLDHYIDHTGPMIPMNPGDSFIYHPSKADNEMPLDTKKQNVETNYFALVGFIVYVEGQPLDYCIDFGTASFSYHLERNPLTSPIFIILIVFSAIWLILLTAMIISQIRIKTLLRQQQHDAKIIEQSINTFINFIEAKDPNTKGHSERVAKISYAMANDMGYSPRECNRIYYIALMHDCGKISIPATILRKPGKLTDEEYEIIKSHTTYGEKMLRDFTSINGIDLGVLYHHERYDGGGYPRGLSGEDIPKIARIICVADSLDAMNSCRCYRPKMTPEEIIEELVANKGKQFDPDVVDCVLKLINQNIITLGE